MKRIFIISMILMLSACYADNVRYTPYPVPVYVVPEPPSIDRPDLPIHSLTEEDRENTTKVMQSYVISVRLLMNYAQASDKIMKTYKELSEEEEIDFEDPMTFTYATSQEPMTTDEEIEMFTRSMDIERKFNNEIQEIKTNYSDKKKEIWAEYDETE